MELQQEGLIAYRRGRIMILDRAGLELSACECYSAIRSNFDRLLPHVNNSAVGRQAAPALIAEPVSLRPARSEEHTSDLQSLMRISYARFCLTQKKQL